jgi:hypothetical protein
VFGIDVARQHDGPVEGADRRAAVASADGAEIVGKLQFTAGEDTHRHHPSSAPRAGNVRQVGDRPAAAGGTAGGAVTASGARSPGRPEVTVTSASASLATAETTDRSTDVVTGQANPASIVSPPAPYTRRSADAAPSLVTMRRGGPRRSCRGAGPPAGHQAADEQRHAGQRHRQRGPALVRGPCLAPGAQASPMARRCRRPPRSARRCAVRPHGWPLRRGRRRWGRSRSRPRPEWPSGPSGARPATGIQAASKASPVLAVTSAAAAPARASGRSMPRSPAVAVRSASTWGCVSTNICPRSRTCCVDACSRAALPGGDLGKVALVGSHHPVGVLLTRLRSRRGRERHHERQRGAAPQHHGASNECHCSVGRRSGEWSARPTRR